MPRVVKYISRRSARKRQIHGPLMTRDYGELSTRATQDKGIISALLSLLLEQDDLLRWRTIEALGQVAAAVAREDLEESRNLVRKLLWSMNDESGSQAWYAAEALGEILYQVPALAEEYTTILASFATIYPFEAGVQWALSRIAALPSSPAMETTATLLEALEGEDPRVRGFAAQALGLLNISESISGLKRLLKDATPISTYDFERGELGSPTVGTLVRQALSRMDRKDPSPDPAEQTALRQL